MARREVLTVAESAEGKISPRLRERLGTTPPGEQVEVLIELAPPVVPQEGSRADRVAALRQRFDGEVRSVAGRLGSVGGVVLEAAWISSTVRGRLPAESVAELARDSLVEGVDLPSAIQPDG